MHDTEILPQNETAFVEFYEWLYGDESTEYRLIKQTNGKSITRSLVSDPDDLEGDFAKLCKLNNNGFNVYAVVNAVSDDALNNIRRGGGWTERDDSGKLKLRPDGTPKRYYSSQNHHITGIRSLFVDIDQQPTGELTNLEILRTAPLTPSLIVQSSQPHKLQAYWLVEADAITTAEFKTLQRQLAKRFNADKSTNNTARILRMPGFLHVKDPRNPMLSRLLESNGVQYSRDDVLSALALDPTPPAITTAPLDLSNASDDWQRIIEAFATWPPVDGERRKVTLLVMSAAYELGVSRADAVQAVASVKHDKWHAADADASTESVATWVYEGRATQDRANLSQLLATLQRDHGITVQALDALKWERQRNAINNRVHIPESEFDGVVRVNTRYLTTEWDSIRSQLSDCVTRFDASLEPNQQRRGMIVVTDSGIGSAKSSAIFTDEDVQHSDSAAFIAPLITLCNSIAGDTHSQNYQDMSADDYKHYHHQNSHRLTITPNSLPKMILTQAHEGSDRVFAHKYLVLDESDAIVARLSDEDVQNEQSMFNALRTHITGAVMQGGTVYFSSAYHQPSEMLLVKQIVNELAHYGIKVPVILLKNEYQVATGRSFELLEIESDKGVRKQDAKRAAFIKRILERKTSSPVAIGTDSEAFATECHEALTNAFPEQKHLLITALTKNDSSVRAFLDDKQRDARAWDSIVYDPVLQSGFDIKKDHHNHDVFLYYCARSVSPKNAVQLAGRFRDASHLVIASEDYHASGARDVTTIKRELAESLEQDNQHLTTTLDGRRVWKHEAFTDIHVANIAHDRWQRSSWRTHFLALLEGMGFTKLQSDVEKVTLSQADTYADIRETVKQHEALEIASAYELTPQQADAIRRSSDASRQQQRALQRFELESYYGHEVTLERVLEDKQQRRFISELALARADNATLQYHRDSEIAGAIYSDGVASAKSCDKVTRYGLKRELRRRALQAACVDVQTLKATAEYHRDSGSVQAFVTWLEHHRVALGSVANIPSHEAIGKNPLQFLGLLLRGMGFTTESRLVTVGAGRMRVYRAAVDLERMPTLLERLAEREAVVAGRVRSWLERSHAPAHTPSFYYRNDESTNTVQDNVSSLLHTLSKSAIWEAAKRHLALKNDPETAAILASLQHAGARIEIKNDSPRIIWQHCSLPMTPETIKNDYLMPHREAIAAALQAAVSLNSVIRTLLATPDKKQPDQNHYELL